MTNCIAWIFMISWVNIGFKPDSLWLEFVQVVHRVPLSGIYFLLQPWKTFNKYNTSILMYLLLKLIVYRYKCVFSMWFSIFNYLQWKYFKSRKIKKSRGFSIDVSRDVCSQLQTTTLPHKLDAWMLRALLHKSTFSPS